MVTMDKSARMEVNHQDLIIIVFVNVLKDFLVIIVK
jgi:hypothetical protein